MSAPHYCPQCGAVMDKVIFFGLPGHFCPDRRCNTLTGLAAYAPAITTDTDSGPMFAFLVYEGSYWRALWDWLRGPK